MIEGTPGNDIIRLVGSGGLLARIVREAPNPGAGVTASEVQVLTLPAGVTGGTFTLTFDAHDRGRLGHAPATGAGSVQEALEGLPNIAPGDVGVSGSVGGPYTVSFLGTGSYATTDVPNIAANGSGLSLTGGTMTVTTLVEAGSGLGTNETQQVTLPSQTSGGTFTLTFDPDGAGPILPATTGRSLLTPRRPMCKTRCWTCPPLGRATWK